MEEVEYRLTSFEGEYREGIVALRLAVFVDEQRVPEELEIDEHDPEARHLVALVSGEVIGTLRMLASGDALKIGRLAVRRDLRNRGVGSRLMEMAVDHARRSGFIRAVLNSQVTATPFYQRFGFREEGEVFDDAGIPHIRMVRVLDSQ